MAIWLPNSYIDIQTIFWFIPENQKFEFIFKFCGHITDLVDEVVHCWAVISNRCVCCAVKVRLGTFGSDVGSEIRFDSMIRKITSTVQYYSNEKKFKEISPRTVQHPQTNAFNYQYLTFDEGTPRKLEKQEDSKKNQPPPTKSKVIGKNARKNRERRIRFLEKNLHRKATLFEKGGIFFEKS